MLVYWTIHVKTEDFRITDNLQNLSESRVDGMVYKTPRIGTVHNTSNSDKKSIGVTANIKTKANNATVEEEERSATKIMIFDNKRVYNTKYVFCPCGIGRLGNMMFQLSATIGVSYFLNHTPAIRTSNPMLNYFEMKTVKRLDNSTLINNKNIGTGWIHQDAEEYMSYNLTIAGYFQSWVYFENAYAAVRNAFEIKQPHQQIAKSFLRDYVGSNKTTIGVHVRRGDFLDPDKVERGRVVADVYYISKAMAFYRQRYKHTQFVLCSDDIGWCKNNINGSDVVYSEDKKPIQDMAILSMCDHMIITAGTFSWWAGWLSDGNVVYLKDFPRSDSAIAKGLSESYYPPHWIAMSNGKQ